MAKETKELIIKTTIKMIQRTGSDLSKITIRDISSEAGISVSQINYHFNSKENLIAVCVQTIVQQVIGMFDNCLTDFENMNSIEKLKHMANLTFNYLYDNENLSRISIMSDYTSPTTGDNTDNTIKAYYPLIENVCKERNITDARIVAELIILALQGAFLRTDIIKEDLKIDLRNPEQREKFINNVFEKYLR